MIVILKSRHSVVWTKKTLCAYYTRYSDRTEFQSDYYLLPFATFFACFFKAIRVAAVSFPIKYRGKKTDTVSAFRWKKYRNTMIFRPRLPYRGQLRPIRPNKCPPTFKCQPSFFNEFFFNIQSHY